MRLWRISIYADLRGMGGEFGKARWHTPAKGKRIVYLAEHPALALVETLVNLKSYPEDSAAEFQLLKVEAEDGLAVERISELLLPLDWRERREVTQALGNDWLARGESALLAVPSAPTPESVNYLLNPRHPEAARVAVAWARWIRYDRRLFRVSE